MRLRHLLLSAGMLVVGACASAEPELTPTAGVQPAPGNGAMAEAAGVRLEIDTDAWRGTPSNLGDNLTPVLVTLTNNGTQPVRIRYNNLELRAPSGEVYRALPPFNIQETVSETVTVERQFNGFLLAPYLSRYYPRLRVIRDPFLFDDVYFNRYYPAFVRIQLPTADMVQKALPEGVLEPGGRVSGFVYFEDPDDDVGRVTLTQAVMSATGTQLGTIQIPLDTR